MGITDKSRQQSALRQQAKQKVQQLQNQAQSSSKPTKADILAKIETLRSQAADIDCETAYQHLMSRIHELSGQL